MDPCECNDRNEGDVPRDLELARLACEQEREALQELCVALLSGVKSISPEIIKGTLKRMGLDPDSCHSPAYVIYLTALELRAYITGKDPMEIEATASDPRLCQECSEKKGCEDCCTVKLVERKP